MFGLLASTHHHVVGSDRSLNFIRRGLMPKHWTRFLLPSSHRCIKQDFACPPSCVLMCMQVPDHLQHVALVCARFKTLEKELDALRTFPGVSVFAHSQDARETATAPVQAQPVVDLSVTGAMSGATYSIRLYLPAS
jgi:hypothetical protein